MKVISPPKTIDDLVHGFQWIANRVDTKSWSRAEFLQTFYSIMDGLIAMLDTGERALLFGNHPPADYASMIPEWTNLAIIKVREIMSRSPAFRVGSGNPWTHGVIDYILRHQIWMPLGSKDELKDVSPSWLLVEEILLESDLAEQHREKIRRQGDFLKRLILWKPQDSVIRIVSLWCGQSPEIQEVLSDATVANAIKNYKIKIEFILVDHDQDAIAISEREIQSKGLCESIQVISHTADVLSFLKNNTDSDMIDWVIAGGLLDYFKDKTLTTIVRRVMNKLKVGGEFFFTNIANGVDNPSSENAYPTEQAKRDLILLRWLMRWLMHHRTAKDLERIIEEWSNWTPHSTSIVPITNSRAHVVIVTRD